MRNFLIRLIPAFLVACLFAPAPAARGADTAEPKLCVMTYNLRFASPKPPNAWPDRRPLMKECIEKISPDLIGTQEGVYPQLKDLAADLKEYDWIGTGRDGGSKGEFMAIFYKRGQFEPIEFDHFWLSDTPNVIASSTWGNSNRRMVTWVKFKHQPSQREFYLFNTHFDHQIQGAREKAAELLRQRITALNTTLPILVTGDFNAANQNKAYQILVQDEFLVDTWFKAKTRRGEGLASFNNFKEIPKNNIRIDWILAKGNVQVDETEIVTFSKEGQFPSDHCPVVAWVKLTN